MKKLFLQGLKLLLVLFVLTGAVAASFAWFANTTQTLTPITGSSLTSYFAGGDGTEEHPYILNRPIHVYNLAWLQNKGYFEGKNYFELGSDIDMAGSLFGDDESERTGAIPPIGTEENPFTGVFNGKGKVISNLWVSTDPDDWKEAPVNYDENVDYSYGVGFFGYIEKATEDTQINVTNLFLKNIEITVKKEINTSVVGLIAGYVDGKMSEIGVDNGIITIKGTGNQVESFYSLVGKISEGTTWLDLPGNEAGGDLVIAPSGLRETEGGAIKYEQFGLRTIASGTEEAVNGAAKLPGNNNRYSAYYYGSITGFKPHPQPEPKDYLVYTGSTVDFSSTKNTITITNNNDATAIENFYSNDEGFTSFKNYIYNPKNNVSYRVETEFIGLRPSSSPSFTGVTGSDKYPTNCIWFKPLNAGHCFIAFAVEKMNSDSYVSIYRYKRTSGGAYTELQELVLKFQKNPNLKNGNVVLFDLEISDLSYEYCIGNSSETSSNPAYFFFLMLAGTNTTGGDAYGGMIKALERIEFVEPEGLSYPNLGRENYIPARTHLSFNGTTTSSATLNFCKSNNILYYRNSVSGITVTENVTNSPISNNGPYNYPPRQETKDTSG